MSNDGYFGNTGSNGNDVMLVANGNDVMMVMM